MGYNGAVIDIPLTSDVEGFVSNIKSQLGKVKNVGIKVDTKSLEDALDAYLKTFKEISNQKLNTGTFSKAQKEISTEIDSLRRRTEALEEGMASLIDVMSGADGGKFASELSTIKQNMLDLSDATRQTVSAVSQLTGNGNIDELKSLSKALSDVVNAYNADTNTTQKFKSEKAAISAVVKAYEEYNDIYDKIDSLEDSGIDTTAKQKELANLQEQLVKTGKAITELMDVAGEKFGTSFHENQDPFGSYFKDIYASIVETTKKIVDTVRTRRNEIEQELKKVQQPSTSQGISATEQSAKIEAKIATTTKGLKTQLQNLLDSVQPYLDENPLEVNVTLASGWGTRKNAELIKQFQAQIDAISEQTDVSQIEKLLNDINKSFGDEISLKFKSNFDEEQKAIRAGIASLKAEVGNKFELNPKISKDAATKLQAQLNELSKKITLKVSEIQLDDSAIQQAVEIKGTPSSDISIQADVLAAIIDAITEKTDFLALGLNSVFETLKDIREILVSYPMDEIVSSSREFVRVLQQAYGIMSKEDLDSMFSNLKKSTESITGKLRGDNLKQLKEILAAYREYQDLGGKNTLSDLGGANNVQQWFKRNKDIILETTDSLNKLDEAEKKVIVDGGETNSLNELSSKLDEVIQKIEEKTNKFREESNLVSQVIPDEITQLGNLEERLKSIKDTCDKLLSTRKVKGISSSLLEAFDQIAEKIKSIGLDQSLGTTENGLGALFGTSAANDFLKVLEKIKAELKEVSDYADGVKISSEISIAPADIERITNAITELRVATEAIQAALSDGTIFKGLGELSPEDAKSIKTVTDALAELANVLPSGDFAQNIDKIRLFVNKFSSDTGVERIEKAAEGVNKLREALDGEVSSNSLLLIFQKISESTDISGLVTELKSLLKIEAAANQAAVAKKEFSEANKMMKESADESSLSLDKEKAAFEKIWNKLDGLNQQKFMPGFNDQIESIRIAMMGIDETADDAAQAYHNLTEEAQKLWKQHGFPEWKKAAETSIASLEAKIAKFGRDNTAIAKEFSDRLDEIRSKIHDGMSIEDVQKLGAEFKRLDADIANAGQGGITFMDTLRKRLMGVNAQLIAQYLSWQDMIRYMRQAVTIIKELDDALVDLKKTTAMSNSDLKEFYYNANGIAKEMGVTTAEIIQQASSWSRLGYNTKEASETMAQLSSQFASISPGMGVEEAQTGLVSIMKAWDVDVSRVERDIMDNINTLGNKFAETNSDIIGGMERAGATFSAIGMSIEDSFALFTGAQEVIQNAETVGTALKTLSLRIRGYDEETEELSEDVVAATGKVADLTKVASNNFAGVSLWADAEQTQYRSLVDYLGDISEIWDEIDAKSQTELLENLFGKRGASVGSAILKNFDQVKNALEAMEQAEGSADREMEIIQESISYKLNNLQQTWVGILQELIDNGMLGEMIDALTAISEVLGEIITTIGPVPTLIAGLGLRELLLNLNKIPGLLSTISVGMDLLLSGTGTLTDILAAMFPQLAGLSTLLAPIAPYLLAIGAAAAALYGIYKIWDALTISVDEAKDSISEFSKKYDSATSKIQNQEKAVEELSDSYFELAKGVDSVTGKNISLSSEDYEEFVSTNQKLAGLFPELISGVDEYGNYILNLGDNADEAREKLQNLLKQEQDNYNYELYKDIPDVAQNANVLVKDANNRIETAKEQLDVYDKLYGRINDIAKLTSKENSPVTLVGDVNSQDVKAIEDFIYSYQSMIDHLASTDPEIASNLRDALKDESVGDEIRKVFHVENLTAEEKQIISNFVKEYVSELSGTYKSQITEATADIKEGQTQLSSAWMTMQKNILGGIGFLSDNDKTSQVLTDFVKSLPSEFAKELEDVDIQSEIAKWIGRVDELSDEQKLKLSDLINADLTPEKKIELYEDLRDSLPEGFELDVPIHFVVDDAQNLIDRVKASKSRLSSYTDQFGVNSVNTSALKEIDDFFNEMHIDTEEEYNLWLKCANASDTATEAMKKYRDEVKGAVNETKQLETSLSFTQSISDLNDLENALNNVGTAMANIDENGKFQLGDLDNIADYFLGLEAAEEKVEYETDAVANALKLLGEGTGDLQQNADAINTIADNYLRTSGILDGLTEKNKELYVTRLQMMGIINAETIVEEQLAAATADVVNQKTVEAVTDAQLVAVKEALVASDANMVNASVEVIKAILDEGNASNATRAAVFDLVAQQTVFSNQNLNVNQKIEALETLANAFLDTASAAKYASEMAQVEAKANSLKAAIDSHGYDDATITKKRNEINSEIAQITRKYSSDAAKTQVKFTRAQYNGGTPVSSKLGYTPSSTADALQGTQAKAIEDAASKAADAAKEAEDSFEQLYDYFERMIKVLDNSIDLLEAHLEDVVGAFAKNTLLSAEEDVIQSKMNGYVSAIDMYSQKASEALSKIPSDVAARLQNGAVAIEEFIGEGNEEVYEAIQDYEKWADKVQDCKLQLVELREAIRQLELEKFNNIVHDFTEQFDIRQSAGIDMISKQIDLLKEAGQLVGESFYVKQREQAEKQVALLQEEQKRLVAQFNEALSKGVQVGSDEWESMVDSLTDVEGSILDAKKAIEEFDNAILELHTEIFNRIQNQFSSFANELKNMQELFNDEALPVATKDNKWTSEGLAQLGLLAEQYELASYQVEQYNQEIEALNQAYLDGRYSATEYADRLIELKSAQWDAVNASEAALDSMRDLNEARVNIVIEGINDEIDAYSELIEKQKDLLSAEKDLYEYQKSIAESEKDITKLQRQLAAIADDESQSARAKRAKLQEELAEAQDALEEKQYDHSVEMQQNSLDEQLEQYKAVRQAEIDALQESLLNVEQILQETFNAVRENSVLIGQEIVMMAQEHGIEMSTALTDAWFQGENAIAQYGQVLSAESSAFIGNIQGVEYQVYELQEQANQTAIGLADMFATRADSLVQQLTDSYMSEENLNAMTNALHDSLNNTIDGSYSGAGAKAALDSIADAANGVAAAADNARAALEAMGAAQAAAANTPSYTGKIYQQGSDGDYYYAGTGTVTGNNIWEKNGKVYVDNGYASGTKRVTHDQIAWTQEKGPEMVISPSSGSILTPLKKGDAVVPADMTSNLWAWGGFNPEEFATKLIENAGIPDASNVQTNELQIGSLITVNGNINDTEEMVMIAAGQAANKIKQSFKELSDSLRG